VSPHIVTTQPNVHGRTLPAALSSAMGARHRGATPHPPGRPAATPPWRRSRPTPHHHGAAPATRGCTALHRARHAGATLSPRLQPAVRRRRLSHAAPDTPHRQRPALRRSSKGKAGSGPKGVGSAPLRCRCCHGRRGRSTTPSPLPPPGDAAAGRKIALPSPSWRPTRGPR
jgi:hypothetical protein